MKGLIQNTLRAGLITMALVSTLTLRAADMKAQAEEAMNNFKLVDPSLTNFFSKAVGYVILPNVGEGGFIIGGQRGEGLLYEKGKVAGTVKMTEVSVGAQVGGGTFAELVFFETASALENFKQNKWDMSAKAKANAAASGVAEHAKFELGVAVFTLPKSGAMVAAALGGQKFKFEPLK